MINRLFTVVAFLCATTVSLLAQSTNPYAPKWTRNGFYFIPNAENTENTLTITARGTIDGVRCDSAYEVGVFVGDRCVVRNNIYSSERYYKRHGYYTTLNVKANRNEVLSFRIYDHRNNVEVGFNEPPATIKFVADASYGSISSELYEIAFNSSTTHRNAPLELNDAADFEGCQYSITADGFTCSYIRNAYLDGGYESIVLPFDAEIKAIKEAGFVFEKLETITETSIRFVELEEDEILKAGVAYIFRYAGTPSDERKEIRFEAKVQSACDDVVWNEGWTGTFKTLKGEDIAGKYILNIKGDKVQKASSKASLPPYHAYLELPTINVASLYVSHGEETTEIGEVQEKSENNSDIIYDLNGRSLKQMPSKAIIIKNGKKLYVK